MIALLRPPIFGKVSEALFFGQ
jgi:hypothetical protein